MRKTFYILVNIFVFCLLSEVSAAPVQADFCDDPAHSGPNIFCEDFTGVGADGEPVVPFHGQPRFDNGWDQVSDPAYISSITDRWDISSHIRDPGPGSNTMIVQRAWLAEHGANCEAPYPNHNTSAAVGMHTIQYFEETLFMCRDHMMTSMYGPSAGVLAFTPNHMVNLAENGEVKIQFNISTRRTTGRDYFQVNINSWEYSKQLVMGTIVADLNSFAKNDLYIAARLENTLQNPKGRFQVFQTDANHDLVPIPLDNENTYEKYEDILWKKDLIPDNARRDTFEITLTRNHISVCMPDYPAPNCIVDEPLKINIPWDKGVVQFSHHSYNPEKGCTADNNYCRPNTWHWDNFRLSPTVPFSITKATVRSVENSSNQPVKIDFRGAAPAQAKLRFTGNGAGNTFQVSFDNQQSWHSAVATPFIPDGDNWDRRYISFFTGDPNNGGYVPEGITSVWIKAEGAPYFRGSKWVARDISLWSQSVDGAPPPPSNTPVPQPTFAPTDYDQDRDTDWLDLTWVINLFREAGATIYEYAAVVAGI